MKNIFKLLAIATVYFTPQAHADDLIPVLTCIDVKTVDNGFDATFYADADNNIVSVEIGAIGEGGRQIVATLKCESGGPLSDENLTEYRCIDNIDRSSLSALLLNRNINTIKRPHEVQLRKGSAPNQRVVARLTCDN